MPIRSLLYGIAGAGLLASPALAQDAPSWADVEAVFAARCVMCHGGDQPRRGLSLESYDQLMAGSENGPVVIAGDVEGSELHRRITGVSMPMMPLNGDPLSESEIALITAWIAAGAVGPAQ